MNISFDNGTITNSSNDNQLVNIKTTSNKEAAHLIKNTMPLIEKESAESHICSTPIIALNVKETALIKNSVDNFLLDESKIVIKTIRPSPLEVLPVNKKNEPSTQVCVKFIKFLNQIFDSIFKAKIYKF